MPLFASDGTVWATSNSDDCSCETLGALMPVPALKVSLVPPNVGPAAGLRA